MLAELSFRPALLLAKTIGPSRILDSLKLPVWKDEAQQRAAREHRGG